MSTFETNDLLSIQKSIKQSKSNMKTLLQLNLDSPFNKNFYRTRKNKLELTKQAPHSEFTFDNICYSAEDINSSIIYDFVIDFSEKNKFLNSTQSVASINMIEGQEGVDNCLEEGHSLHSNLISASMIEEDFKQPDFTYTVLFDQIVDIKSIQHLIKDLSCTEIFKKEKIKIGHFLAHENGVYDFHRKKVFLTDTERQELDREYAKFHGSIEDNFMWIYNKEINLCEEIKLANIPHLLKTLAYIPVDQFNKLPEPTLGVQLASNITKAEEIKHKELQHKKILELFVINIGEKIRVVLILFNYNKNYTFNLDEQRELSQLLMMHGVVSGQIKYQTTKIEILNRLMRNSQKLYYVMYFPGPKLSLPPGQPISNEPIGRHIASRSSLSNTGSFLSREKAKCFTFGKSESFVETKPMKSSQYSRVNNNGEKSDRLQDFLNSMFNNYTALKTKDRDSLQKIIKQYLVKKEDNLKLELDRIKERLKELKQNQRIEECEVAELKTKCTKALQKISQSVFQLQKMGIHNVERHMDWLKLMADDKKLEIKEIEQDIEEINKKTIENRKSHEYFYSKMVAFRDRLKAKQLKLTKSEHKENNHRKTDSSKESRHSNQRSYLGDLSLAQLQQLQHHKQKLKAKLIQKLKNSEEKKQFLNALNQIRAKASKLQLTRLEQKYFDLLHN